MKALAVTPRKKYSAHLRDVPVPDIGDSEVLVRSVRAGVCGTDREIHEGLYGSAPRGVDYLVLGHESSGIVESVGRSVHGFEKGQYVVRAVRRPCDGCANCSAGANDMCSSGNFSESGIKELHGCMAEYFKDESRYLIQIPADLGGVSVLLEPLSVVEKVLRQARTIQQRLVWRPKTAMVIGAGPIGILQAMLLINEGMDVYVAARSAPGNLKSRLAESIGAAYVSTSCTSFENIVKQIGSLDFVVEASGDSSMAFQAIDAAGNNGVVCLTSITCGNKEVSVPSDKVNLNAVRGNKVVFGSVNANIIDHYNGVRSLKKFMDRWPDVVNAMFTHRVPLQQYERAFESRSDDIKTTIEIS